MPKMDRFRALYILKYLCENTDDEHPMTLVQIQNHLVELNIDAIPKTIDNDITALQELGFDIIRNRSIVPYNPDVARRVCTQTSLKCLSKVRIRMSLLSNCGR